MSEFLEILTHGRRLQGAVKDLSVDHKWLFPVVVW